MLLLPTCGFRALANLGAHVSGSAQSIGENRDTLDVHTAKEIT